MSCPTITLVSILLLILFCHTLLCFSELSFGLFTNPNDVVHHFNRLLRTIELRPEQYLTSEGFLFWRNTVEEDRRSRQEVEEEEEELDIEYGMMYEEDVNVNLYHDKNDAMTERIMKNNKGNNNGDHHHDDGGNNEIIFGGR